MVNEVKQGVSGGCEGLFGLARVIKGFKVQLLNTKTGQHCWINN